MAPHDLLKAADAIAGLGAGSELTARIGAIEAALTGSQRRAVGRTIANEGIDDTVLKGALTIKDLAGQINVVIHAVGIVVALPHILERDERIESLSLGAGNTGRTWPPNVLRGHAQKCDAGKRPTPHRGATMDQSSRD